MSIRQFDLNLLIIFDVLIEERSVTRSAEKLAMSQPAVSHALGRLRKQLDDPILVKSGHSMEASPRALEIHRELRGTLQQIDRAVRPQPRFEPGNSKRVFSIASTDYVESLILPPLLSRIQATAPGVELNIHHLAASLPLDDIESGNIDLAISLSVNKPRRFVSQFLLEDGYLCAVRRNHPIANQPLTMARYLGLDHLLVAPAKSRQRIASRLFSGVGKAPRVVANIPHFLAALHATSESSVIVTGPALLLKKFQTTFDLHLIAPPFELPPTQIDLVWHEFKGTDPGIAWLRREIEAVVSSISRG